MSLLTQIKADQLQARKDRNADKASLLTTLIGEASIIGKNDGGRETNDQEVINVVKKFIKNNNEVLNALQPGQADVAIAQHTAENVILSAYLPKQLTEDQLTDVIKSIRAELINERILAGQPPVANAKDMGKVMGLLKTRFEGAYDGTMASRLTKLVLA